jgi:hypothetical protein
MRARSWELVTTNEPAVIAKSLLDAIVVEDGESDRRLPDPSCTDESDGYEGSGETNDLLDQLIAPETGSRRRGRWLSRYAGRKCKIRNPLVVEAADLVWTG